MDENAVLLVQNADVYAPDPLGHKDVLIVAGRIVKVADTIEPPRLLWPELHVVDAHGLPLAPGFVDAHLHVAGSGGEGGFQNRTPPATLTALTLAGITTFVGLLGTDGITRSVMEVLADARRLTVEGITGFIYSGAYWVPTRTLTGSIRSDLVAIPDVLGCGEIAVSDDRGSEPGSRNIAQLALEVRAGALLAGKKGVLHLHMGDESAGLAPVIEAQRQSQLPMTIFHPTHLNRNRRLLEDVPPFLERGGCIDITAGIFPTEGDERPVDPAIALKALLLSGSAPKLLNVSSDANGSAPVFNERGEVVKMSITNPNVLLKTLTDLVKRQDIPLETALHFFTRNPANQLGLYHKGAIAPGADADLLIFGEDLHLRMVIARGRIMVEAGQPSVFGTFEQSIPESSSTKSAYGVPASLAASAAKTGTPGRDDTEGDSNRPSTGQAYEGSGRRSKGERKSTRSPLSRLRRRSISSAGRSGRSRSKT